MEERESDELPRTFLLRRPNGLCVARGRWCWSMELRWPCLLSREPRGLSVEVIEPRGWSNDWRSLSMEPRGVLPGEPPLTLVWEEKPVEVLLTPPVLSVSLCWVLALWSLRSWELERLWPDLRFSKAFLSDDMAAAGGAAWQYCDAQVVAKLWDRAAGKWDVGR